MADTGSDKIQESYGQGVANIIAGCFGGMAGCTMINQSVINMQSGGRGRLSTLWVGLFLLLLILVLADLVRQIPMGALVTVMIMVSIGTLSWKSLKDLRIHPNSCSLVMIATLIVTVVPHDLAQDVLVGVRRSGIFFARKVARILEISSVTPSDGTQRTYTVSGEVFFASAESFGEGFDSKEAIERVMIDVSGAHIWGLTAVAALDRVVLKFRREGTEVELLNMNEASVTLVDNLAAHDKPGAFDAPTLP